MLCCCCCCFFFFVFFHFCPIFFFYWNSCLQTVYILIRHRVLDLHCLPKSQTWRWAKSFKCTNLLTAFCASCPFVCLLLWFQILLFFILLPEEGDLWLWHPLEIFHCFLSLDPPKLKCIIIVEGRYFSGIKKSVYVIATSQENLSSGFATGQDSNRPT